MRDIQIEQQFQSLLERIPALSDILVRRGQFFLGRKTDLSISFGLDGKQKELIVEVKEKVTPKSLREISVQWRNSIPLQSENTYPVIAAPYLSIASIEVCRENNVGCIDAQGNCLIAFGSLYIEIKGIPNSNPSQRSIQSLFSPKSSRVARILLSDVSRWWQIQGIAKEADISIGLVSDVKNRLLDEELIVENGKSVRVKDPRKLIGRWLENYSYRKNKVMEFYSLATGPAFEKKIAAECAVRNIRYGLALFTGAGKVAPFVRMEKQFVYIEKDIDTIAAVLNLKTVDSGANVILLLPYDPKIFYRSNEIDGIQVVSDLQLYLDLKKYKGRGEEAADAILAQRLEPQWARNLIMNSGE
jgi:hypothetical protein